MKIIYQIRGWILIRPIRWFFGNISRAHSLRVWPERNEYYHKDYYPYKYHWPNIHWWIAYKTIGKFFLWLNWNGWRPFCDWTGGYRRTYPMIARIIHKIGKTCCWNFYGYECYHCAADEGDPSELVDADSFVLTDSGTSYTPEGTDHWFKGITTCPKCGYKAEFGDSSL